MSRTLVLLNFGRAGAALSLAAPSALRVRGPECLASEPSRLAPAAHALRRLVAEGVTSFKLFKA
ncbi:hypothetical protein AB0E01_30075, partial [Nocardia vinacea]|uniref:hypothetical protein n=1 Tax=Nocardia vinacea TaxID=96468 RepID=UPI0033C2B4B7